MTADRADIGEIIVFTTSIETPAAFNAFSPSTEVSKAVFGAALILAITISSPRPAAVRAITSAFVMAAGFAAGCWA